MAAKTTFWWYAAFVALAVICSALAVPLSTVDAAAAPAATAAAAAVTANDSEDKKPSDVQPEFQEQLKSSAETPAVSDPSEGIAVDPSVQQQQQQPGPSEGIAVVPSLQQQQQQQQQFGSTDAVPAGSDQPLSETDPSLSTAVNEKIDSSDVPATVGLVDTDNAGKQTDNVGGTNSPPTSVTGSVQSPDSSVVGSKPVGHDQRPPAKPYSSAGNVGTSALPFFMQFPQPLQPFTAFQPFFPPFTHNNRNQPYKYQIQQQPQFPFGASIGSFDPFDPFVNPMRTSPLGQLMNDYTNLLALLNKGMSQVDNAGDDGKEVANKPVTKTTTKTEIIDGHVVQINETTYSDGDANHKSFYHFKEIQVMPEGTTDNKKVGSNDNKTTQPPATAAANDPETMKVNTNEIVPDMSVETFDVNDEDKQNSIKKTREPVPLEDHYQMAASSRYAPYVPYGSWYPSSSATLYYNRPPAQAAPVNYNRPPAQVAPVNYNRPPAQAAPVNYNRPPIQVAPVNYNRPPIQVAPVNYNRPPPAQAASVNYNRPPPAQAASVNYNRPQPQAPVSLHGDTYVNELMAAQQQASGMNAMLPPDVEIIDVNGKPQQMQGGQFYYNDHHNVPKKFPGSKY